MVGVERGRAPPEAGQVALPEAEEYLLLLADNLPDSAVYQYTHEPDGSARFLFMSRGIERLNGVRAEDVLRDAGVLVGQILPEYRAAHAEAEARSARELKDFDMELPVRRPDGEVRWMKLRSRPCRSPDGRVIWNGVQTDVTDRRRIEEQLRLTAERFEAALQASPVAVFNQDRDLRYTWIHNPSFGYAVTEVVGKRDTDLFPRAEDAARLEAIKRDVMKSGVAQRHEVPVEWKGSVRHYDVTVQPQRDASGAVVGVTCAAVDVTERKKAEEALREAARRKDEFLAMLAHELRNPLAPIRNAVQLLKARGPGDPALVAIRATIERQLDSLIRLVDDLLDVSRVSRGKITLRREPLDLAAVVHQAVETSRPLLESRHHQLTVSLPPEPIHVEGDLTRLAQVVSNLLNNAAKYTDAGGRIALSVEGDGAEAVIVVRDDGRGIDSTALALLFDLFYQVDRTLDRSEGGLGIGLSLVKSLVEMHGGRVEAHSAGRGKGSEFVVRLPRLREAPSARSPALPADAGPVASLRVLVVDDNLDAAETLAMLLELDGHRTLTAHDGQEAVEVALAERPDVVLLDIGLPLLNGYEACRAMRAGGLKALIVAMTGYGQDEDRRMSQEAGFDAHQVKPVELKKLRELLARRTVTP